MYELHGDSLFKLKKFADEVSKQVGKAIAYSNLPPSPQCEHAMLFKAEQIEVAPARRLAAKKVMLGVDPKNRKAFLTPIERLATQNRSSWSVNSSRSVWIWWIAHPVAACHRQPCPSAQATERPLPERLRREA